MPCNSERDWREVHKLVELAKRQVRDKFPNLLEGSSGWTRAVENRRRRLGV